MTDLDVTIIGAGQAGLATAYYLRRFPLTVQLIDASPAPGGSWTTAWESLRLFSPWRISSLPGWRLPPTADYYPSPQEIVAYFAAYERRYDFDIRRGVRVLEVSGTSPFRIRCSDGSETSSRVVINCTGNASRPFIPFVPGARTFTGRQLHSSSYRTATEFAGQRVVVVGGGNSGAQIAADLADIAEVTWCTLRPPRYLPNDYDGEALFSVAKQRLAAIERGEDDPQGLSALGDIVIVPSVKAARDAGQLIAHPMFDRLTPTGVQWDDSAQADVDTIVWCTGFRPALSHLRHAGLTRPSVQQTAATDTPGMFFVGYGDWVGPAADTIIGVAPFAKLAAQGAAAFLGRS